MKRCFSAFIIRKENENYGKIEREIIGPSYDRVKEQAEKLIKYDETLHDCTITVDETTDKYCIEEE